MGQQRGQLRLFGADAAELDPINRGLHRPQVTTLERALNLLLRGRLGQAS